ncbi:MAG: LysM peptidoglycan-binding domain-containing protein [Desulfobacterales bacterium]|nr:LysM peptidoglycan-binding domain-containing protein [Desulfobacterales bacterium]
MQKKMSTHRHIFFFLSALLLLLSFLLAPSPTPRAEEKTPPYYPEGYREAKGQAPEADATKPEESALVPEGKTLRTEEYVIREGDWLIKILKSKGLLEEHNLPELLEILRKLNTSLHDVNLIRSGEKIVILVKVVPSGDAGEPPQMEKEPSSPPAPRSPPPKKLKSVPYKVKRGDSLSRLVMSRYDLSQKQFIGEYLRLFKKCNPSIKDPDRLLAGKVIRLPQYPPVPPETGPEVAALRDVDKPGQPVIVPKEKIVPERQELPPPSPIQAPPEAPPKDRLADRGKVPEPQIKPVPAVRTPEATIQVSRGLGNILSDMGEEWLDSGDHFIPLKSSGHINLKAESYPIIRLSRGMTVIVDLHNALPEKMANVIQSSWGSYRVVHLSLNDDLRASLDKILRAFNYQKIFKKGEPLKLGGSIPVSITGDWIVTPPVTPSGKGPAFIVINLIDPGSSGTPGTIRGYLKQIGVEVIEYPSAKEAPVDTSKVKALEKAEDAPSLIKAVLNLTGQPFSTRLKIPAYETANDDFKFMVEADFYLKIRGRSHIIDVTGLDPEVVTLLKDRGTSVLSLAKEKEPVTMVARVLEFLNVKFEHGPHVFLSSPGEDSRNVRLSLSGIIFSAHNGDSVLVTPLNLPTEIAAFLSQRGYRVLILPALPPSSSGSA